MPHLICMLNWILSRSYSLEFLKTASIVLQSAFKVQISPFQTSFPLLHYFPCSKDSETLYIDYSNTYTVISYKGPAYWRSDSLGWVALFRGNSLAGSISPFWTCGNLISWYAVYIQRALNYAHFMSYKSSKCDDFWGPSISENGSFGPLGLFLHDLPQIK